jgi:ATP-dependent RNA helicase RhlE
MLFNELGLSAELLRAVDDKGYQEATPIQQQAIPLILEGRDVLAAAQTGTGKTAGFTLPLLQKLQQSDKNRRNIRALVLTPTRELAAQVAESVRDYGAHLPFKTAVIFGGVKINAQIKQLRNGVDVVVATPGRLLDHMQQKTIDLSKVEFLVLDEADRMLDMGFIRDIRKVIKVLPKERQNLLFSATFSNDIRRLANDLLDAPVEIEVAQRNKPADLVTQVVHPVDKRGANRLAEQLAGDGIESAAIHGNKSQGARTRALADFKANKIRVLVATDIAARGLDIDKLPYVVNYELPFVPEDYVHRIGRTARAGQKGNAVSLVCVDELNLLKDIENLLGTEIEKKVLKGYEPDTRIKAEPVQQGRGSRSSNNQNKPSRNRRGGQPPKARRQRRAG